ncbi:SGNH hydrolase [Thozetella sp. PMI_491]|nr:SGNH hydrolase [Thozetella sp. PMI_491]
MSAYDFLVLLGDSITEWGFNQEHGFGWVARLSHAFISRLTVVNTAVSGYNTDQAVAKLPVMVPPPSRGRIKILVVFYGANDARLPDDEGTRQQHVPLERYRENLAAIVTDARVKEHNPHIVVITPPPIDERLCEKNNKEWGVVQIRKAAATKAYAEAAREVAEETGAAALDLWSIFMERAGWKPGDPLQGSKDVEENPEGLPKLLRDGLHLTVEGEQLLFESLFNFIKTTWPEEGSLPWVLPRWDDDSWLQS